MVGWSFSQACCCLDGCLCQNVCGMFSILWTISVHEHMFRLVPCAVSFSCSVVVLFVWHFIQVAFFSSFGLRPSTHNPYGFLQDFLSFGFVETSQICDHRLRGATHPCRLRFHCLALHNVRTLLSCRAVAGDSFCRLPLACSPSADIFALLGCSN